jgi:FkbM family methyltransferase
MTNGDPVSGDSALWGIRFLRGREPKDVAEIATLQALPNIGLMRAELLRDGEPGAFHFDVPVDATTVTWGFRMILGRPPESPEVVEHHLHLKSAADLAASLFASSEFKTQRGPWLRFDLCGELRRFVGHPDDVYLQQLEGAAIGAAQVARLAAAVRRAKGRTLEIIDIGANLGLMAAALAPQARRILAVEPNPVTAGYLEFNIGLNRLENVSAVTTALGDTHGEIRFLAHSFSAGSHVANDTFGTPLTTVPMTTLDILAAERGFKHIDFIKLDVEGFERQVLSGAAETIARCRPVIHMEFNVWALIAMGDTQPMRFLRELVERYPYVHTIADENVHYFKSHGFKRLHIGELAYIMHRNIFQRTCCEDLVLSYDLDWLDHLG